MMRKFTGIKLLVLGSMILLLALPLGLGGCDKYDDSALRRDVDDLKSRIEALEGQLKQVNKEIETLQKAVDGRFSIAKVETTTDGYKIIFTDNSSIELTNGKNGAAGTDGKDAPVVGVKKDTDGIYYWTMTVGGKTEWLTEGGQKLRVTGESIKPVLSVDAGGYWTISYDGGTTYTQILDAQGKPVSALAKESGVVSLFRSITQDDANVYFELSDGSIVTVAKRSTFYLLIRKAPETASFVYGETMVFETETAGVEKTVVTKPDEWKVTYADKKLTITAPSADHAACADLKGEVSIIYFSANGQSDAVKMGVVVGKDYTGTTAGDNYTVDITEITDQSVKATITPKDNSLSYYATVYDREKYDKIGEAAFVNEQLGMFNYFLQAGMDFYLDQMLSKGVFNYKGAQLKPQSQLYIAVFGVAVDKTNAVCTAATPVMTVPFDTKNAVVINTRYRISVSDISWYGAKYVSVPTDDLGYLHGFVKKSDFEKSDSEAAFMESVNKRFYNAYSDALYMSRIISWDDLTSTGTQSRQSPDFVYNMALYDAGLEDIAAYTMPLVQDTEYYVYSFSSTDNKVTSPLSKAAFRTGKFTPSEGCTFTVTTSVERQDITVNVTPSNRNCNYLVSVTESAYYRDFETDLQFAADDVFWAEMSAEEGGKPLSELIVKGNLSRTYRDCKAATGYEVCVYGCTADGVITTEPVVVHVVTKGTVDQAPAQVSAKTPARVPAKIR